MSITFSAGWDELGLVPALDGHHRAARRARGFGDFWQHCLVAEGAMDVAVDAVGVAPYDIAAVRLLVEEAGGRLTDRHGVATHDSDTAISSSRMPKRDPAPARCPNTLRYPDCMSGDVISPLAGLAAGLTPRPRPAHDHRDHRDAALAKLSELRAEEAEAERLGLRLEIASDPGGRSATTWRSMSSPRRRLSDEVRNHDGLRVIIPGKDVEPQGATLDYTDSTGLVLRNPNRPTAGAPGGPGLRR